MFLLLDFMSSVKLPQIGKEGTIEGIKDTRLDMIFSAKLRESTVSRDLSTVLSWRLVGEERISRRRNRRKRRQKK